MDKLQNHGNVQSIPGLQPSPAIEDSAWTPPRYLNSVQCTIDPAVVEKNRGIGLNPGGTTIEQYKILRTKIKQIGKKKKMNTIMVTSPNHHEGKTVTAINISLTFARDMKKTVLLVDCDFTGQDIHTYLGIESELSLVDFFLDDVPLHKLIIWPGIEKMTLISGNRSVPNSTELLSSDMMEKLIQEMGTRYDDRYVFFDSAPVLGRSEAISMAPMVDGIIMVVASGSTSEKDAIHAASLLPQDKFLGFVFNRHGEA